MSAFKESLYEKKCFIYQVGEDYYAIGANTFAKITDSPETDNIELFQNPFRRCRNKYLWLIRLLKNFKK